MFRFPLALIALLALWPLCGTAAAQDPQAAASTVTSAAEPGLEMLPLDNTIVPLKNIRTVQDPDHPGRVISVTADTIVAQRVAINFFRVALVQKGWQTTGVCSAQNCRLVKDGRAIQLYAQMNQNAAATNTGVTIISLSLLPAIPQ